MPENDPQFGHTFHSDQPAQSSEPEEDPRFGQTIHPIRLSAGLKVFGQYDLVREVGRGGMGVVWLARDPVLDRDVALKFLPEIVAMDDEAIASLKRETKRNLLLTHPHIVRVHDLKLDGRGMAAVAMEYVKGKSLSQKKAARQEGCFEVEDIREWVRQVCEALQYAHEDARVVHRDLKPANILIDDRTEKAKLADFGIAQSLNESRSRLSREEGFGGGTLPYMSPQQLMGEVAPRVADDVYALGATIYDLLTGKPPFFVGRIDLQIVGRVPPPLSRRREEMGIGGEKIPAAWEETVAACLAKQAEGRPESVASVWKALTAPEKSPAPKSPRVSSTKSAPFENHLGMRFVPVPIVGGATDGQAILFSIWQTRVQDYAAYAAANPGVDMIWKDVEEGGYKQEKDHPVLNVSWEDATAFCKWLTRKERSEGRIGATDTYRLPTDHEWSCAVGIGSLEKAGDLPSDKNCQRDLIPIPGFPGYPWGNAWPPPKGAGNLAGEEYEIGFGKIKGYRDPYLKGYRDPYPFTAPVGSFTPSAEGLYDLSGNVWEWCEDWYLATKGSRVLRGGSWCIGYEVDLRSSSRLDVQPSVRFSSGGFRCLLALAAGKAQPLPKKEFVRLVAPNASPATKSPRVSATKSAPFENHLGMRFVPVPITGGATDGQAILFSIWQTRVQDYAAYAAANPGVDMRWKDVEYRGYKQEKNHPVVNVSWEDANAFCKWLTGKERSEDRIGAMDIYRLPTDHEWSCAVGIGSREKAGDLPSDKNLKIPGYPWGDAWPPPKGAGNFGSIGGDSDPYVFPAPVGSFTPSADGLYDLSGNVYEWCEDWLDSRKDCRVLRGGSCAAGPEFFLRSSSRYFARPSSRRGLSGFRLVVVGGVGG